MTKENKVTFGLQDVHFAPYTFDEEGNVIYETPIPMQGAIELSLEPRGDMVEFFADNQLFYTSANNQGYEGTLSISNIPEIFAIEALGEVKDEEDMVLHEIANTQGKPFALLFQFEGDKRATRHLLYNCTANRPTIASTTKTDSVEPNANELTFTASPILLDGKLMVKTKTAPTTPQAIYDNWYKSVYKKVPAI